MAFSDHMKVLLGVDSKGFNNGLAKAESRATGFGKVMKSKVLPLLGAAAFARTAKGVMNFGASIGDLSTRLGVNAEFLQKFQYAAEQSGVKSEGASIALQRFARRTAEARETGGALKEELDKLGISLTDSGGAARSTEELFTEFGQKLSEMQDPSEKLRVAFKFLDTEGVALTQMFQQGGKTLQEYGQEAESLGLVMSNSTIKSLQDADATLLQTGRQFKVMLASALQPFTKHLDTATAAIGGIINILQRFGGVIKAGTAAVVSYVVVIKSLRIASAAATAVQSLAVATATLGRTMKVLRIAAVALAMGNFSKAAKAATVAMRAFSVAVAANPIGITVAAVAALVTGLVLLTSRADDAKKKVQELEKQKLAQLRTSMINLKQASQDTQLEIIKLKQELLALQGAGAEMKLPLAEQLNLANQEVSTLIRKLKELRDNEKAFLEVNLAMQEHKLQLLKQEGASKVEQLQTEKNIETLNNRIQGIIKRELELQIQIENAKRGQKTLEQQLADEQTLRQNGLLEIVNGLSDEELALRRNKEILEAFAQGQDKAVEAVKKRHEFEDKVVATMKEGKLTAEQAIQMAGQRVALDAAVNAINANIEGNMKDQNLARGGAVNQLQNHLLPKLDDENTLHKDAKQLLQDQLNLLQLEAQGQFDAANALRAKIQVMQDVKNMANQLGIKEKEAIPILLRKNNLERDVALKKNAAKAAEIQKNAVEMQANRDLKDAVDAKDRQRIKRAREIQKKENRIKELQGTNSKIADKEIAKLETFKERTLSLVLDDQTKSDLALLDQERIEIGDTHDANMVALQGRLDEINKAEIDANANRQQAAADGQKQAQDGQQMVNDAAAQGIKDANAAGAKVLEGIDASNDAAVDALLDAGDAIVDAIKDLKPDEETKRPESDSEQRTPDIRVEMQELHSDLINKLNDFANNLGSTLGDINVEVEFPENAFTINNEITIDLSAEDIATETTLTNIENILDGKFVNQ
jgi:hypothetical protein